jgi:hypothetical protein
MIARLLREPRKLHSGDAVAWAIILTVIGLIASATLSGCADMEKTAPCNPYLAGMQHPQAVGCEP